MADKQAEKPSKIRRVEYYRLWAGNSDNTGTWDTDLIQIPVTTKAVRATLYQPDIQATFSLTTGDTEQMIKARTAFDGKPVTYGAAIAKLAPGVVHLVALARIPGLMPNMSDDHLSTELSSPRYTTPLLRSWIPWLKQAMTTDGGIVVGEGLASTVGVLNTEPGDLDALVIRGVKEGCLSLAG